MQVLDISFEAHCFSSCGPCKQDRGRNLTSACVGAQILAPRQAPKSYIGSITARKSYICSTTAPESNILSHRPQRFHHRRMLMQSASTSSQSIIELLLRNIETTWDRKYLPKGVKERLSKARAAEPSSTERILLDHGGITTWVAYVRATHGKLHFKGQTSQNAIIASFGELSKDDQILVAQKVADGQLHPSVATIINQIDSNSREPRK